MVLDSRRLGLVVAALAVAVVATQAAAHAVAPQTPVTSTGEALGKTGSAYLSGLGRFAAAVLWNRLEPQYHDYYEDVALSEQVFILPSIRMITILDPHLEQPYGLGSFVVARRGDTDIAIELARRGIEKNPQSGYLRANLAMVLMYDDKVKNLPEMVELAEIGLGPDIRWSSEEDLYDGLVMFRTTYELAGNQTRVAQINGALEKLRSSESFAETDHDHDGDGEQDH